MLEAASHLEGPGLGSPKPQSFPVAIREVLFPSDLAAASDRAFDHARLLAQQFRARLTLYHVIETGGEPSPDPRDPKHEVWRRTEKAAREHLSRRLDAFTGPFTVVVERKSSARRALLTFIGDTHPDITVMATHGREGLAHLVVGSVTEAAVHGGGRPVLCVREPDHGVALPYRRILVPTDLSAASRAAFPLAATLARSFGAEVLAVHVAPLAPVSSLSGVTETVEARVPSEFVVRAFLLPEFAEVKVTPRVVLGSAWDRISELAGLEKADLVVMSTHGHDSLADRVLGSHTERVVRHAPCPVLVV